MNDERINKYRNEIDQLAVDVWIAAQKRPGNDMHEAIERIRELLEVSLRSLYIKENQEHAMKYKNEIESSHVVNQSEDCG